MKIWQRYLLRKLTFTFAFLLLSIFAVYVLVEAIRRIGGEPEIDTGPMLVVAVLGLVVNLIAFALLREGAKESINVEGAYLEVVADTLGSVGVIAAAVLMWTFGWTWVDPLVGGLIGLWILPRTVRLGSQAVRILLQAAPPDVDLQALRADLAALPDVLDVHDLHVWTLTSEMENATAHLVVEPGVDGHHVLDQARALLQDRYRIAHATLQVEPSDHTGCDELEW